MRILTVFWSAFDGKSVGQYRYTTDYVKALRSQLDEQDQHLTVLSDHLIGDELLRQSGGFKGWWSKIEIFSPENRHLRPCLCIDLDTFIVGDITPILKFDPTQLWLIGNFWGKDRGNSGLFIAPRIGISDEIWERSQKYPRTEGDGDFLNTFPHGRIDKTVDGILSYKAHKLQSQPPPENARVVCFHGAPKPPDTEGWAKEFWNRHST